jgi:hypothetical protein
VEASYGDPIAPALVTKTNDQHLKSIGKKIPIKPDPGLF